MKRSNLVLGIAMIAWTILNSQAQVTASNLVTITIVGFTPAQIVNLVKAPVISIGTDRQTAGPDSIERILPGDLKVSTFTVERPYSATDTSWRTWANTSTGLPTRHATLAFLASPGNVVNTLEFLDCWPVGYSLELNTNGVVVERLTLHPEWIPWP